MAQIEPPHYSRIIIREILNNKSAAQLNAGTILTNQRVFQAVLIGYKYFPGFTALFCAHHVGSFELVHQSPGSVISNREFP